MEYNVALAYLHSLNKFGINLGLERVRALLELLGNPQNAYPCIHITGTNGKGSVTAMVCSILQAAGLKVGRYISPALQNFNERISISGVDIPDGALAELITRLRPAVEAVAARTGFDHPTEFEVVTAAAFAYFRDAAIDMAVLEVGMGGRLDSTNVISTPRVAVITTVAYDHMDILGDTLELIAAEKAGIIKEGGLVISAATDPAALPVIAAACRGQGATLWQVDREITYERFRSDPRGQGFAVSTPDAVYPDLFITLRGAHQIRNAATAVGAIGALGRRGIRVELAAVRSGLAAAVWPGRLEVLRYHPTVVLDGAHNPSGAQVLSQALQNEFSYQRLILVLGILRDKAYGEIIASLAPLAGVVILTRSQSQRAADPAQLRPEVRRWQESVYERDTVAAACQLALELAGPQDLVCITGSLYTIGEARTWWQKSL